MPGLALAGVPVAGPYNCYEYEYRTHLQKPIGYVTLNADGSYKLTNGSASGKWSHRAGYVQRSDLRWRTPKMTGGRTTLRDPLTGRSIQ